MLRADIHSLVESTLCNQCEGIYNNGSFEHLLQYVSIVASEDERESSGNVGHHIPLPLSLMTHGGGSHTLLQLPIAANDSLFIRGPQ